jgi:hypothetical protein
MCTSIASDDLWKKHISRAALSANAAGHPARFHPTRHRSGIGFSD